MRVLIVDDEPLARARTRALLAADADITAIDECGNGADAVAAILARPPDLVLLDVEMPELDGFDVVRTVGIDRMPAVIFLTAHDRYAIRAFDSHAVDYLLKPVGERRFADAVQRAKRRAAGRVAGSASGNGHAIGDGDSADPIDQIRSQLRALFADLGARSGSARPGQPSRLAVRVAGRVVLMPTADIDWLEALDNYVRIHAGSKAHTVRETLSHVAERLPPDGFMRIHRSVIINIERVREIRPRTGAPPFLILAGGTKLAVGRAYRATVEARLTHSG
jgi:two-component system, LytTR family, response regulator